MTGTVSAVTAAQRALWFLTELGIEQPGRYNDSRHFRLTGEVDHAALARATRWLVDRHEALRTAFIPAGGQPVASVSANAPESFEHERVHAELGGRALYVNIAAQRRRPFDLREPQKLRVTLQELGPSDHLLHVVYHQIAVDEAAAETLVRELGFAYEAALRGETPVAGPPVSIRGSELADGERKAAEQFWSAELAGAAPRVDLPAHRPPSEHQHEGSALRFEISPDVRAGILGLAEATGSTAPKVAFVAYALLLSRWSGSDDIVIGTPFSPRDEATRSVVAQLENPLPIRLQIGERSTARELLVEVDSRWRRVSTHSGLPFADVVRSLDRAGSADGNPLFGAHFRARVRPDIALELSGASVAPVEPNSVYSRYELDVVFSESADSMSCEVTFSLDRFERDTVHEFVRQYEYLLAALVEIPDDAARALPLEAPDTAVARMEAFNATTVAYPRDRTLGELFVDAVERHSSSPAIGHERGELTFREFGVCAERARRCLVEVGVRPGDFVQIVVRPDVNTVAAMVGTVLAGAAYVPLDPHQPPARLREIAADARAVVTIGDRQTIAELGLGGDAVVDLGDDDISVDGGAPPITSEAVGSDDTAYMIYTSGSTGRPKGVVVPHRSAVRQLVNSDFLPLSPGDVVAQVSNLAFDVSVIETWGPLLNGARLELVPEQHRLDPRALVATIRDRGVTALFLSSLHFAAVVRDVPDAFATLHTLMVGADVVPPSPMRQAMEHGRPTRIVNAYGPTEASVWCSFAEIEAPPHHRKHLPIGRPAANNRLYVLNAAGALAAPWEPGELAVGGDGVATGYWRRPNLTAQRFVDDPFVSGKDARMYRTGDRVVASLDGELHFLGRVDRQVKLRGHRVELGEIEAKIAQLDGVENCRVAVRGDGAAQRLVGYVAAQMGAALEADALLTRLQPVLPGYMIPRQLVVVDALPTNDRGKIDLTNLPEPSADAGEADRRPRSRTATVIVECFGEVLDRVDVRTDVDFFALGGHSLIALELLARLEERLGQRISLVTFMRHSSIDALERHLEETRSGDERAFENDPDRAAQFEHFEQFVRAWTGTRARADSLLVQRNESGTAQPIYWCFQGEGEFGALARHLGKDVPIAGMRSVIGVAHPKSQMVADLARRYASEILELDDGPYTIGGNCAGAEVAFAVAWELERHGREVELLVLMERVIDKPFPGDVLLLFGDESEEFNPYLSGAPSDEVFERNYGSYRVETIAGGHGRFFGPEHVEGLAATLLRYHRDPFADPLRPPQRGPGIASKTALPPSSRGLVVDATTELSDRLPPGDIARVDRGEHTNRRFLLERAKRYGPVFKATTSGDRLLICIVGFDNCKRLLRQHARRLGPNSLSLGGVFPKGIIREMHGEDHTVYRGSLVRALSQLDSEYVDAVAQRTAGGVLRTLSRVDPADASALDDALDMMATSTLIETCFGVAGTDPVHQRLVDAFRKLGPDGLVWVPDEPQLSAYTEIREVLLEVLRDRSRHSIAVLQLLDDGGDLDETSLGNLIYMVEIGRFDMASLARWMVKLAADHPDAVDRLITTATGDRGLQAEAFVLETLRLHQSERLMRVALEDLAFDGYLIPKDSIVRLCLWESHKDGAVFPDPFAFDPSRFTSQRFTSDDFAPFGLGARRCPASDLAVSLASGLAGAMATVARPSIVADGPPIHGAWHWEPSAELRVGWTSV